MQYNVDTPGTVVASLPSALTGTRAASHGKFYQWDKKVAWATTGDVSGWNSTGSSSTSWQSANNPCPNGFVVPTKAQYDALISACNATYMNGTWSDTNYGYLTLTNKTNSSNRLEFTAVGYRNASDGTLGNSGTFGDYWSSTQGDVLNSAYRLYFNNSSVVIRNSEYRATGRNIRCVSK